MKKANPAFTCDLWHSRTMKEYFTMTVHWIHIGGTQLQPTWELRHRMLGSYPVQATRIDHQGACAIVVLQPQPVFSPMNTIVHKR